MTHPYYEVIIAIIDKVLFLKKMYLEKYGNADLTITESVRISQFIHTPTCVKPSLIRLCLKVLANCSSSSRSLGSSRVGVSNRLGGVWLWGRDWIGVAAVVRVGVAGCREQQNIKMGLFSKDKEEGKCRSISSGKKKSKYINVGFVMCFYLFLDYSWKSISTASITETHLSLKEVLASLPTWVARVMLGWVGRRLAWLWGSWVRRLWACSIPTEWKTQEF